MYESFKRLNSFRIKDTDESLYKKKDKKDIPVTPLSNRNVFFC